MPAGSRPAAPLAVLVGPTAVGKSDIAVAVAERLGAEIVSADSRQVYRGMDVATAKPEPDARARVRHHLIDVAAPDEPFSVADWLRLARTAIAAIGHRGRLPLVVGGTGLYVSALVDGYRLPGGAPASDVRAGLLAELEAGGLAPLAERLATLSPALAERTDLRNQRRVTRALERLETAPVGERDGAPQAEAYPGSVVMVGLTRPRDVLAARITRRARAQFEEGLLEETAGLLAAGYAPELSSMSGIGYREAARHLAGEWSLEEAIEAVARRTRRYAKRQGTWFRRDPRIRWVELDERASAEPGVVDEVSGLIYRCLA